MILEMLKGLPGSGKSTYAKAKVAAHPEDWVRVNKDDLRAMLHAGVWKGKATERQILEARDLLVMTALTGKRNVIVDDTNLAPEHEAQLRSLADKAKALFVVNDDFLAVPVKDCISNDLKRPNSVGHKVINKMHVKYLLPAYEPPQHDDTLPTCIIVDIDGTLAHMAGRSPYDYSQVGNDLPDSVVRLLVYDAWERGDVVIVMSGRESSCREETLEWLNRTLIWTDDQVAFDALFMRAEGDKRDDSIVKRELYEKHILHGFNVRYVLDDRDRVVDMWRAMGLKCLQVSDGDF